MVATAAAIIGVGIQRIGSFPWPRFRPRDNTHMLGKARRTISTASLTKHLGQAGQRHGTDGTYKSVVLPDTCAGVLKTGLIPKRLGTPISNRAISTTNIERMADNQQAGVTRGLKATKGIELLTFGLCSTFLAFKRAIRSRKTSPHHPILRISSNEEDASGHQQHYDYYNSYHHYYRII